MALPPMPYPATVVVKRTVDNRASVAFRGNRYSVNPGMGGIELTLRHRLGTTTLDVFTPADTLLVSHRLAPDGAGSMVRTEDHREALEKVILSQFSTDRPCDRKANKPPGAQALAERAKLMGAGGVTPTADLDQMAEIIGLAFPGATEVSIPEVSA